MTIREAVIAAFLVTIGVTTGAYASTYVSGPPFLAPTQYDAAEILPPPPAAGSPRAKAEVAELEHIATSRTPAQWAAATADAHNETGTMFAPVLGPKFDLTRLPATAKMLDDLAKTEDTVSKSAKAFFHRPRPWIVDPKLQSCQARKPPPALNSYPSGHSTVAFLMGVVLASLIPDRAQAILARSKQFAENRLVCGMHFRSDIVAGQTFGTFLAAELMHDPAFKPEYAAAAAELQAAGL